jgi:hypothetical protein
MDNFRCDVFYNAEQVHSELKVINEDSPAFQQYITILINPHIYPLPLEI